MREETGTDAHGRWRAWLGVAMLSNAAAWAPAQPEPRPLYLEVAKRYAAGEVPAPSDHAPLVIDVDSPGVPFDARCASAEERIAAGRR